MTRVADLMRAGVITCPPEALLGEVARRLSAHRVHSLLVAEDGGPPLGIISDTDLLAGEWLAGDPQALATMREMTARELMTTPVLTVDAGAPATEAISLLRKQEVHRLVVTQDGRAAGVVSVSDFVAGLAGQAMGRQTVGEVMSRGLVICRADTSLAGLARGMTERSSRSVVVIGSSGRPLGVVTGVDLMLVWAGERRDQTAADLMHAPVTIGPRALLREAADVMLKHHIHRLIVLDPAEPEGMPMGLISTSDIVAEMAAPGSAWQA